MKKVEAAIQRELVKYLKGIQSNSSIRIKIAASQNENSRHAVDLGTDVGEPDLRISATVNNTHHILYLELKKTKGTLRGSQKNWNKCFDSHFVAWNCKRDVAYGYLEAKNVIDKWVESLHNIQIKGDKHEG